MEKTERWELSEVVDGICQLVKVENGSRKEPLRQFANKCKKDMRAPQRLLEVIKSIPKSGISHAVQAGHIKVLDGSIVEIREMSCSVRAFSYLHRGKQLLVIYKVVKTHSGKSKDNYKDAIGEGRQKESIIKALIERKGDDDNK